MAGVLFDTLGLTRRLRDRAGFTPEHVEEAQAIVDAIAGPAVSKADLTRLILTIATGQPALLLAAMFSLARLGR